MASIWSDVTASAACNSISINDTSRLAVGTSVRIRQCPCNWETWQLLILFVAPLVLALILAWRVDVNEFSLHLFYRNRLVRCYLGATNPKRCPHPFTGFDPTDDILLRDFSLRRGAKYSGPHPLLNAH